MQLGGQLVVDPVGDLGQDPDGVLQVLGDERPGQHREGDEDPVPDQLNFTQRASTFRSFSPSAARDRPSTSCTTAAKTVTSCPSGEVRRKSMVEPTRKATSPSPSRIGGCPNRRVSSRSTSALSCCWSGAGWGATRSCPAGGDPRSTSPSWSGARNTGCGTPRTSRSTATARLLTRSLLSWLSSIQKLSVGRGPDVVGWRQPSSTIAASCADARREPSSAVGTPTASQRTRCRAGELNFRKGGWSSVADSALMVRSAVSSMMETTSLRRSRKPAQASAVLRSRSKSSISADRLPPSART